MGPRLYELQQRLRLRICVDLLFVLGNCFAGFVLDVYIYIYIVEWAIFQLNIIEFDFAL